MDRLGTYVPGMNEASGQRLANDLYSRRSMNQGNYGDGTYVEGMSETPANDFMPSTRRSSNEPVVGFLYSISRMGIGEYWPLHLGTNTIGRDSKCDIQLKEMSVSEKHASINIKQMRTTGLLIASVQDVGSKNGMYLNDEELDFENHTCKNLDVLTIGPNYKLLLILINAKEFGLSRSEEFVPYEDEPVAEQEPSFNPRSDQPFVDDGTIDLSGKQGITAPGGTKIM